MGEELDLSGAVDMLKSMLESNDKNSVINDIMSTLSNKEEMPGVKTGGIDPENVEMLFKMQKIMSTMNNPDKNHHTVFLQSLKPLLKEERRKSVDNAVRLLSIGKVIDIFKEMG